MKIDKAFTELFDIFICLSENFIVNLWVEILFELFSVVKLKPTNGRVKCQISCWHQLRNLLMNSDRFFPKILAWLVIFLWSNKNQSLNSVQVLSLLLTYWSFIIFLNGVFDVFLSKLKVFRVNRTKSNLDPNCDQVFIRSTVHSTPSILLQRSEHTPLLEKVIPKLQEYLPNLFLVLGLFTGINLLLPFIQKEFWLFNLLLELLLVNPDWTWVDFHRVCLLQNFMLGAE